MDLVKTMRFKFVRYCVNKAYADMNLQGVPAEVINLFDDVVTQIRDLEKYFTSVDSIIRVMRVDIPEKLKLLKERDPQLAREFVERLVNNCFELEEVVNSRVKSYLEELLRSF